MTADRQHLLDHDLASLTRWFASIGEPPFRAGQVMEWVFRHGATEWDAMSNLSRLLRQRLAESFDLFRSTIVRNQQSSDGTVKLLLRWPDGATSECVLIPDGRRRTACIGSQVGCPVGCRFCASGMSGVERNLTRGEIVEQLLRIQQFCAANAPAAGIPGDNRAAATSAARRSHVDDDDADDPGRVTHVVFMGSGEPLANFTEVRAAVRTINAPWGPNVGARKITLSTVGLPKQIRMLADEQLQLNLALSLHAPTESLRAELIPWAEPIGLDALIDACRYYFDRTGREITLEYILLAGVNDRSEDAAALARLTRRLRCNVNLLRYNPVAGLPYARPSGAQAHEFQIALRRHGVNAHLRTSRGTDIDAACGQLRRSAQSDPADASSSSALITLNVTHTSAPGD